MGFNLNKVKEKKKEIIGSFTPLELNEGNVQAIFNKCLAGQGEKFHNIQVLGPSVAKNPSEIVHLAPQKIKENEKSIQYLISQLKTIHVPNTQIISLQEGFFRYDNFVWTKDYDKLFKLYSLGLAEGYLRGFGKISNDVISSLLSPRRCVPTLSPKDPNFPTWWEQHKSEWEAPKKDGQEPADD